MQGTQTIESGAKQLDECCYHSFEVKQFKGDLKKNSGFTHYIFIKSMSYEEWHITIPIPKNMSKKEAGKYQFIEYHVTKERQDNLHYYYKVLHQKVRCDPEIIYPEWEIADAVSKEIFGTGEY